jgi:hypothetical protein
MALRIGHAYQQATDWHLGRQHMADSVEKVFLG